MLQSVDAAKTHEIMARFRPIAPKPQLPPSSGHCLDGPSAALLRARPCRTRKRGGGRADCLIPAAPNKRPKALLPVLPHAAQLNGLGLGLSAQGFARGLSILPSSPARAPALVAPPPPPPPVEQDLLKKLQEPRVITPMPVRPVGSSISVGCISRGPAAPSSVDPLVSKKPEEVEEEVESVAEPAVISDSNNRVWLANSAYKEMVGQPECLWLETMASASSGSLGGLKKGSAAAARRINGNVKLDLTESSEIPVGASGFSCRVKIEWACNGRKSFVDAPCDVSRLQCDSKDYKFTWRIHTAAGFRNNCLA